MSKAKTVLEVRILSGGRAGEQQLFFDAAEVRIGRHPSADVLIPDAVVSRQHAVISRQTDDSYLLSDHGSTAGMYDVSTGQKVTQIPVSGTGTVEVSLGPPATSPRCLIGVGTALPFGRYLLTGRLGGGGMAEVFLARQTGLGGLFRPVALKLIQPEMFEIVDASAMFLDEARIASEINHHNVVKIFDVGEQDGVLFLAMEYLRGVTVASLIGQFLRRGETMPPDLAAAIIAQSCAGLHAAHQLRDSNGRLLNVVHRDVSPSNLMVLPEGLVKVIDFGVARADTRLLRKEEGLQGKPAYMSPEQIMLQPLDARSDVFALGVVLYEMCSGQPLFARDDTAATFYAIVRGDITPLHKVCPQASPLLEAVVHKALARPLGDRYGSAAELCQDLDKVVEEAGGRFSSIGAIGRFLLERGIHLQAAPPSLLHEVPKALYGRKRDDRLSEFVDEEALADESFGSVSARPASGRSSDALPSTAKSQDRGFRSGELPQVARSSDGVPLWTVDPRRSPGSGRTNLAFLSPLADEPHRLAGLVLGDRYRLLRFIGSGPKREVQFPKLYYQAELLSDGPGEQKSREAGILRGGHVAVAVCGRGPKLQPLSATAKAKLSAFAATREPKAEDKFLLPMLSVGTLDARDDSDPDGSGASFVVMPLWERRLPTIGQLTTTERLRLIERLFASLTELHRRDPRFVHGAIRPSSIGLCLATDAPVLLDFCLELIISEPLFPPGLERPLLLDPYLAPECYSGAPQSHKSDVFSVGVLAYEMLGGDLQLLTQALRSRRGVPRLPPQRGVPPHVENAILAALHSDPAQRLRADDLSVLIGSSPAAKIPDTAAPRSSVLMVPASGDSLRQRLPSGEEICLRTLPLLAGQQPSVLPLPLTEPPDALPAELSLLLSGETIQLELTEPGRGRDRPSLYHDVREPSTRLDCLTLLATEKQGHFDVGHRRSSVARIGYASQESPSGRSVLEVSIAELGVSVRSAGPLRRLTVLYTKSVKQSLWYALCLCLG